MARTVEALNLAGDDAARRGQSEIVPENILIGLLRVSDEFIAGFLVQGGIEIDRLRERGGQAAAVSREAGARQVAAECSVAGVGESKAGSVAHPP